MIVMEMTKCHTKDRLKTVLDQGVITLETVEIICRCKDCIHSDKVGETLYCYFWEYEQGMSPNTVEESGFCSNAENIE